ncbi:MAG: D-alanyl-D-alanine carboxypeptidase [Firmicutes bacterium]|nr:D-alanyl-D-alanine carboxypeptidase [Bacillota bacterium]
MEKKTFGVKKTLILGMVIPVAVGSVFLMGPKCCKEGGTTNAVVSAAALVSAAVEQSALEITAKSAFLVEANSGKVLFTKDEHNRLPIASMVKITTLSVIFDALEAGEITLEQMVPVSREASGMGGSQAFLDFEAEYSVKELIRTIIVASANDSCVAMAELIAGSESAFVDRMNELATRLGMENTRYANATGLPAAEAYSTAADVAKVFQYMISSPFYDIDVTNTWMYDFAHPSGRVTGLTNTNKHAKFFDGCLGGKTGFTNEAGHCITVSAERGKIKPIAVIIGAENSQTRFNESGALMRHAMDSYESKLIVDKNQIVGQINVKGAMTDKIDVFAKDNFFDLVKKGDKGAAPTVAIEMNEHVKAPHKMGDAVGKIIVTDEGVVVSEIDLVTGADIDSMGFFGAVKKVTRNYKI